MTSRAIEITGLTVRFGETVAVDDVTLSPAGGKTTVLIGPSGCGKTTVLRSIIGLAAPETGEIRIGDTVLSPANAQDLRRQMGYVIQDGGLFPHMTAAENVTVMARFLGWDAGAIKDRLEELSALTNFPRDGLARYPAGLSGGQRQRVALMRALMLEPEILLLDEPLGALDPLIRYDLQEDLRLIFRDLGKTVVMVTHDLAEAAHFADEIVLMGEGRIVQQGRMEDLSERPANDFVARFLEAQRGLNLAGADS